jgi:hypothetical protein
MCTCKVVVITQLKRLMECTCVLYVDEQALLSDGDGAYHVGCDSIAEKTFGTYMCVTCVCNSTAER